jgi:hypothetical protein
MADPVQVPDKSDEIAPVTDTGKTSSTGLEALMRDAAASGEAGARPVEKWNPPYCGDIGMKIRRDGTWMYQGSPIGRIALVKLFASILRKDDDGKTYLVTPAEKVDVEVEDAPFLAVEMAVSGEGGNQTLTFRTNVDDVVTVDADLLDGRYEIRSPVLVLAQDARKELDERDASDRAFLIRPRPVAADLQADVAAVRRVPILDRTGARFPASGGCAQ